MISLVSYVQLCIPVVKTSHCVLNTNAVLKMTVKLGKEREGTQEQGFNSRETG